MSSVGKYIPFVNKQAERLEGILKKHPDDKNAKYAYRPIIETFRSMAADLGACEAELDHLRGERDLLSEDLRSATEKLHARASALEQLELKPKDIEDLPEEVLTQLSFGESEFQEFAILRAIESAGGTVSLDRLIILLWRASGEVHERPKLNAKLYRMTQKGMVFSHPDKRGVYSIFPVDEPQPVGHTVASARRSQE